MALKKTSMAEGIMGGVRKNIEISNNSIENGTEEELISAPVINKDTSSGRYKKDESRFIRKSVFFDPDTEGKLEDIKRWKRFKEGKKNVSFNDLVYDIVTEWLNNNYETMNKKYSD